MISLLKRILIFSGIDSDLLYLKQGRRHEAREAQVWRLAGSDRRGT